MNWSDTVITNTGKYIGTCKCNCPCMVVGLCVGLGSSSGQCLWLIGAFCGLEMYELCWYLLLLHCGGPEMNVLFICC